jgi:hypothetical protein
MTLQNLRQLNKKNGGCFFDKATLKAFGETMKDYFQEPHRVQSLVAGQPVVVEVVKVSRRNGKGTWYFSTVTGRVLNGFPNSSR